jgi:hypothetical protein
VECGSGGTALVDVAFPGVGPTGRQSSKHTNEVAKAKRENFIAS